MNRLPRPHAAAAALLLCPLLLAAPAAAQLLHIRTVPVATGDQFLTHPTARLGMAGVGIALDDRLADPFLNPAAGARVEQTQLFASGGYYRIGDAGGDGRTLPLGALVTRGSWFGTASLALQQLTPPQRGGCCFSPWDPWGPTDPNALSNRAATNLYGSATAGRRLGDGRTSVGLGLAYAGLDAVDGVELLYANSAAIRQDGGIMDLRVGLSREMEGDRRAELVLLHNRVDMKHDVTYVDVTWRPNGIPIVARRVERNLDRTRVWGAHANYTLPLAEDGWRGGAIATVNYMTHPKIPNYEIMNIPRDPGHSWATNVGVGVGREEGPVSFGLDLVYEPIWSNTWADAESDILTERGETIAAGEKTIENDFRFHNARFRIGAARESRRLGFQLGLEVRSISYTLDQYDFITARGREQKESWMEWVPAWGVSGRFPELEVRYAGRLVSGTGRPGIAFDGMVADGARLQAANFIVAPSGPLSLQETRVLSHQVTVAVPLGARR